MSTLMHCVLLRIENRAKFTVGLSIPSRRTKEILTTISFETLSLFAQEEICRVQGESRDFLSKNVYIHLTKASLFQYTDLY